MNNSRTPHLSKGDAGPPGRAARRAELQRACDRRRRYGEKAMKKIRAYTER